MSSAVRRRTVLNVGDDEPTRRALSRVLRRAGYHVREATGEEPALRAAVGSRPDAVVLGERLTPTVREALSRQLKEHAQERPFPILHLVRRRAVSQVRRRLADREEEAVLGAPADPVAVVSLIGALLQARDTKLAEQQARPWQEAFDALHEGICVLDRDGRLCQYNQAMADLIGTPIAAMLGYTCDQLFAEAHRQVIQPLLARCADSRRRESAVVPVGEHWYRVTVDPIPRGAGEQRGAVLSVADVTEEVRAEQSRARLLEVERARARDARFLDLTLESTPAMLAYIDRDLRFVRVNARYAQALCRAPGEVVGRSVEEALGTAPSVVESVQHARDTGEPLWRTEVPPSAPRTEEEARSVRYDVAIIPIKDERGEVEGLVISVLDVSDKVRLREEQVERERSSRQLAETLTTDISHRVKNNLMLLAGLLQMQVSAEPDSTVGIALRDTIARLLTFADLHAQLNISGPGEVDILEAVRRIADITRRVFTSGRIDISVDGISVGYPPGAATALSIAANELITNAIKHGAPAEDDRLHVRVQVARHDEMLCMAVWNSGNPVPEGFNIDERTHLGLRLVRDLAAARHGGSLTLRPHQGGTLVEMDIDDQSLRSEG